MKACPVDMPSEYLIHLCIRYIRDIITDLAEPLICMAAWYNDVYIMSDIASEVSSSCIADFELNNTLITC